MNSSRCHRRQVFSIVGIYLAVFLGIHVPQSGKAQTEGYHNPKIYLFILDELEVCKPGGYKSYDIDEPSGCEGPDIRDIVGLKETCSTSDCKVTSSSRQYKIKLGSLFEPVSAYSKDSPENKLPNDRRSMVLLFVWEKRLSSNITLRRIGNAGIKTITWAGRLNNDYRWFNHQRLDAFHPMNEIKWTLKVGKEQFEFSVEP
jgi:hypothetical protein